MIQELSNISIYGMGIGRVVLFIFTILFTFVFAAIIRKLIDMYLKKSSEEINTKKTNFILIKYMASIGIYGIGFSIAIYMVPPLEKLAVSLFAGAGIIAVVIGFASQKAFSNIISGVFIAMFKPFRVGDRIRFGTTNGIVEDITLRHTILRNYENKRFIVPNAVISDEIIENYHIEDEKICKILELGISYDSDINKAIKIIQSEAIKHPDYMEYKHPDLLDNKNSTKDKDTIIVRVVGWGDSSINLKAWIWAKNPGAAFRMGCDLYKSIKERFDKEGIEIPFPHRTVVMKTKKKITKRKK